MTTTHTTSQSGSEAYAAAEGLVKAGTRRIFKGVMRFAVLPILLCMVAQMGLFVRQDIWALSLWWLLPLGTVVAVLVSLLRDLFRAARKELDGFDWKRFPKHPLRTIKNYRRVRSSANRWQAFQATALTKMRNRAFFWVVPLVLFVSFLILIFSRIAESTWDFVTGNQNVGQNGFGLFSLLVVFIVSMVAVSVYWQLMRASYGARMVSPIRSGQRGTFSARWATSKEATLRKTHNRVFRWILLSLNFIGLVLGSLSRMTKIVFYTACSVLAFTLVMGCSITINSGF